MRVSRQLPFHGHIDEVFATLNFLLNLNAWVPQNFNKPKAIHLMMFLYCKLQFVTNVMSRWKVFKLLHKKKMSTWQKLGTSVAVTVTCLCWSLGHAEQLLFSCVNSKVSICNYVTCFMSHFACHMSHVTLHMSHVICQMLMLILGTCWTSFVFMCKLKSEFL